MVKRTTHDRLFHVGYDGAAMPVAAKSKQDAYDKAKRYLESRGYRLNLIVATPASEGYREWVRSTGQEVLH
jgi:transposase